MFSRKQSLGNEKRNFSSPLLLFASRPSSGEKGSWPLNLTTQDTPPPRQGFAYHKNLTTLSSADFVLVLWSCPQQAFLLKQLDPGEVARAGSQRGMLPCGKERQGAALKNNQWLVGVLPPCHHHPFSPECPLGSKAQPRACFVPSKAGTKQGVYQ